MKEKLFFNFVDKTKKSCYTILEIYQKGDNTMKEMKIKLFTIQQVREFVNNVILQDFEVDLVQGRYLIDAKSIMGIFSLDLLAPITLVAHSENTDAFFASIARFAE